MGSNSFNVIKLNTDEIQVEQKEDNQFVKSKKDDSLLYLYFKRGLDIVLSIIGLIVLIPVLIIVGILIKKEDPKGPIVFKHIRIGKDGKEFGCLKFRSMFVNAQEMLITLTPEQIEEFQESFKIKDDPRITKIGKFIRKTSIDELPQLLNIIKGDMSLVGPRPIIDEEMELYGRYQDMYKSVRPGLTGYWQVNGRSDTTYDERVGMDVYYINNRNLLMDIKLIVNTVTVLFGDKNAY